MKENIRYYLAFSYCLGIGPVTFRTLLKHYSSVKKAYNATRQSLEETIGKKLSEKIIQHRLSFDIEKELRMIEKSNISILTQEDTRFPKSLLNIPDPPICLYIKGNFQTYNFHKDFFFAVVGTRKPTSYGEQIARMFSYDLAREGIIIVSGMAMGIDAIAHEAALDAGNKTIAFLGCGVNIVYPPINRSLHKRILQNDGLIISEFPPNMRTLSGLFVQRNRLISGLSRGVLVAEGLKDSGSLITARFAAEQGKDVFAPPSPITSELSEAPNLLIKEGAKMVTSVNDILEEYQMSITALKGEDVLSHLNEAEKPLYQLLLKEPYDSDEISRSLKMPVYKVLTILSQMELRGIIFKGGGKYQIKLV